MKNKVAELRMGYGWTQQELAHQVGVSRQTIVSVERGHFDPSLTLAFALAACFATPLEVLFTYERG